MDYKDTLLMPHTDFKMRGGLTQKEPEMQKRWHEMDLYNKKLELNKGNEPFVLHLSLIHISEPTRPAA